MKEKEHYKSAMSGKNLACVADGNLPTGRLRLRRKLEKLG